MEGFGQFFTVPWEFINSFWLENGRWSIWDLVFEETIAREYIEILSSILF